VGTGGEGGYTTGYLDYYFLFFFFFVGVLSLDYF
jgi:hypothetical protein